MFKGMPLFSTIFRLYGMLTKKMPAVIRTTPAIKTMPVCLLRISLPVVYLIFDGFNLLL